MAGSLQKVQSLSSFLKRGTTATISSFQRHFAAKSRREEFSGSSVKDATDHNHADEYDDAQDVPTSGICRPLSDILKELNKKVPDSLISIRTEANGFSIKYVPWSVSIFSLLVL